MSKTSICSSSIRSSNQLKLIKFVIPLFPTKGASKMPVRSMKKFHLISHSSPPPPFRRGSCFLLDRFYAIYSDESHGTLRYIPFIVAEVIRLVTMDGNSISGVGQVWESFKFIPSTIVYHTIQMIIKIQNDYFYKISDTTFNSQLIKSYIRNSSSQLSWTYPGKIWYWS